MVGVNSTALVTFWRVRVSRCRVPLHINQSPMAYRNSRIKLYLHWRAHVYSMRSFRWQTVEITFDIERRSRLLLRKFSKTIVRTYSIPSHWMEDAAPTFGQTFRCVWQPTRRGYLLRTYWRWGIFGPESWKDCQEYACEAYLDRFSRSIRLWGIGWPTRVSRVRHDLPRLKHW